MLKTKDYEMHVALEKVVREQLKDNDPIALGACLLSLGYFVYRQHGHTHEQLRWMLNEISDQSAKAEEEMKESIH